MRRESAAEKSCAHDKDRSPCSEAQSVVQTHSLLALHRRPRAQAAILLASSEVQRSIVFAVAIIVLAFLPLFTLLEAKQHRLEQNMPGVSFSFSQPILDNVSESVTASDIQRPLVTVIVGGLLSAVVLTLLVMPVLYFAMERRIVMRRFRDRHALRDRLASCTGEEMI